MIKAVRWELVGLDSAPACATDVLHSQPWHALFLTKSTLCQEPGMPSDAGTQKRLTHWLNIMQVYLENSDGM